MSVSDNLRYIPKNTSVFKSRLIKLAGLLLLFLGFGFIVTVMPLGAYRYTQLRLRGCENNPRCINHVEAVQAGYFFKYYTKTMYYDSNNKALYVEDSINWDNALKSWLANSTYASIFLVIVYLWINKRKSRKGERYHN